MFRDWGFLISEMVGLIVLAALLGLLAGWLIFGGRKTTTVTSSGDTGEAAKLKADLEACGKARADQDKRIAALREDLDTARDERDAARKELADAQRDAEREAAKAEAEAADARRRAAAEAARAALTASDAADAAKDDNDQDPAGGDFHEQDYDKDGVVEGKDEGIKPEALTEARGGQPDDLKQIKGIGVKLEKLCHKLGFFHFDQLANWTDQEVAWVDANLEGFKGRVSRDKWVEQARLLADGGETEFSKRAKDGKVY
ncbi:hypothetical protein [Thalassococcus lentus]|uniref:NADH dehydrogenase subunit E n=1 Tax=Thalassococcus lentus TaxID=1210524 RepID=A0ABT4XTJ8_9RHOB|nr:hypothetical protein [Thalassococcus lentus]MDA7425294.1 hypothetical protein [Thalassococcus lentus]